MNPILDESMLDQANYVLVQKSVASGDWTLVSISKTRQPITNERQERIVINKSLTAFAPDYTDYSFQTYVDRGNYNFETTIMHCKSTPLKAKQYGPCNSEFASVFVPMSVTKAYVAGRMGYAAKKEWEDPLTNTRRYVDSPQWVLQVVGAFEKLGIPKNK